MEMILTYRPLFRMPRVVLTMRSAMASLMIAAIMVVAQGCTAQDTKVVVGNVAAAIPTIQSDINIAADVITGLDPSAGVIITGVMAVVNPAIVQLQILCTQYAQSKDATILASINTVLNTMLNSSASGLLDAAKITDPVSRATAIRVLAAIQTGLQLAYTIFSGAQTKTQIKQTAAMRTFKVRDVAPYLDADRIQLATGYTLNQGVEYASSQGF